MMRSLYTYIFVFLLIVLAQVGFVHAQTINLRASDLRPKSQIFFSPQTATFLDGSTFEIPVYLDTKGQSVNAVDLRIKFDPSTLSIVNPSGGKSIIGVWVEPPSYDNINGTAHIVGTIPGGIVTNSGLLVTLIFRAKSPGNAYVTIPDTSQVLLNDGAGTATDLSTNRGSYTITPKPPEGVTVYSETHPFQDKWYNNNSPVLTWDKEAGVTGFSYTLDDKPTTIPDNTITSSDTVKSYQNLTDGLWYFHVKALKSGVWGGTSNYLLKIDTTPPAIFTPTIDYIGAAVISRFLVSFSTTDSLSGIDHYEVGVIDKSSPTTESPVFIQTESPYQLPFDKIKKAEIIVRAFDRAGNIRDESIDATVPFVPLKMIMDNAVPILLSILGLIILYSIIHYFYGHTIIAKMRGTPTPPVTPPIPTTPITPPQPVVPTPRPVPRTDDIRPPQPQNLPQKISTPSQTPPTPAILVSPTIPQRPSSIYPPPKPPQS